MKTYYELLDVPPNAPGDVIKHAFRREIARYHPDKVQHLGQEFQQIASARAAELTEAYRILMDEEARQRYDQGLADASARPAAAAPPPPYVAPGVEPAVEPRPPDRRFQQERATTGDFVRKAVFAKLRDAVAAVSDGATARTVPGVDAAYSLKAKGGLFRKAEPPVTLLAKYVAHVDGAAIEEAWPAAAAAPPGATVCLLLLGGGIAPQRELSGAVADLRRKTRKAGPILVPVDVRDWEALFPPETPAPVRAILQRLRAGEA